MRRLSYSIFVVYLCSALLFTPIADASLSLTSVINGGVRYGELLTKAGHVIPIKPSIGPPQIMIGLQIAQWGLSAYEAYSPDTAIANGQAGGTNPIAAPTPSGWSDPNSPPNSSPTTTRYYGRIDSGVITGFSSIGEAATATAHYFYHVNNCSAAGYYCPTTVSNCVTTAGSGWSCSTNAGDISVKTVASPVATSIGCEVGYLYTGGTCVLTYPDQVKWPNDGVPTFSPVNGSIVDHSREKDTVITTPAPSLIVTGTDAGGNPTQITISPSGMDVKLQTVENGASTVHEQQIGWDGNGVVTQYNEFTTSNTTISNYTPAPASTPLNIQFPSDYARENTAQESKNRLINIDSTLTGINSKLDVNPSVLNEPKAAVDSALAGIPKTPQEAGVIDYNSHLADQYTPAAYPAIPDGGTCVDPIILVLGHSETVQLCRFWVPWREGIGWALWVCVSVFCYRRISGTEFA